MLSFSTIPVSISFVTISLPTDVVSSILTADCLFYAPTCALEFTVGPPDPPSGSRVLKPQEDKNRASSNHRITSTQSEVRQ